MEKINLCVSLDKDVVQSIRNLSDFYGFSTSSVTNRILKIGLEQVSQDPILSHKNLKEEIDNA